MAPSPLLQIAADKKVSVIIFPMGAGGLARLLFIRQHQQVTTPHGYKPGASGMTRVCRPTPIKASSRIFLLPLWSRPRIRPQWGHS